MQKTNTILDEIITQIRKDLVTTKNQTPITHLEKQIDNRDCVRDFTNALRRVDSRPRIIAECKKASPSKGLIREDFRPQEFALQMQSGGAAAISVLTEKHRFLGSPEYLRQVRKTVKLPVIRKDFIVDNYQIFEAAAWGADAILLIAAALEPIEYQKLFTTARGLGLHVLSEIHNANELDWVLDKGAQNIGVNSRNLKTFKVDLEACRELIRQIPKEFIRIAESGFSNSLQMHEMLEAGADGFLIGETLMRAKNPGDKLREMLNSLNTDK